MGGYSGALQNDVLQYNSGKVVSMLHCKFTYHSLDTGTWSQLVTVEGKVPSKRSGHSADLYLPHIEKRRS
jgi:hypothetical protein